VTIAGIRSFLEIREDMPSVSELQEDYFIVKKFKRKSLWSDNGLNHRNPIGISDIWKTFKISTNIPLSIQYRRLPLNQNAAQWRSSKFTSWL